MRVGRFAVNSELIMIPRTVVRAGIGYARRHRLDALAFVLLLAASPFVGANSSKVCLALSGGGLRGFSADLELSSHRQRGDARQDRRGMSQSGVRTTGDLHTGGVNGRLK